MPMVLRFCLLVFYLSRFSEQQGLNKDHCFCLKIFVNFFTRYGTFFSISGYFLIEFSLKKI